MWRIRNQTLRYDCESNRLFRQPECDAEHTCPISIQPPPNITPHTNFVAHSPLNHSGKRKRKCNPLPTTGAALDLSQLCVKEGRKCWALYLDALLLSRDGNVLDACSIAFKVREIDLHRWQLRRKSKSNDEPEVWCRSIFGGGGGDELCELYVCVVYEYVKVCI